jgi:hypothetical protein
MEDILDPESPKIPEEQSGISYNAVPETKETEKSERAFNFFNSSIKRAENLLSINFDSDGSTLSIPENKLLDCYRAVIVLSISALDAYVKTFLTVEIRQCLAERNLSPDLKLYIKEELFNKDKDALYQVIFDPNFLEIVIAKFDDDFEKKSFQGQKSIDRYMKLAGIDQIFKKVSRSANISPDNLQSDLERFTNMRHSIVHCGDHDLTQTEPTENKITVNDAENCIEMVKLIAKEIHKMNKGK